MIYTGAGILVSWAHTPLLPFTISTVGTQGFDYNGGLIRESGEDGLQQIRVFTLCTRHQKRVREG